MLRLTRTLSGEGGAGTADSTAAEVVKIAIITIKTTVKRKSLR
jgi:hypothetical protein